MHAFISMNTGNKLVCSLNPSALALCLPFSNGFTLLAMIVGFQTSLPSASKPINRGKVFSNYLKASFIS
jgi:hypothetical protein